jgi:hypothetical protein
MAHPSPGIQGARRVDGARSSTRIRASLGVAASAALLAGELVAPAPAAGQEVADPRLAVARRVDAAPRIDGRLDDAAWQGAPVVAGFRQREPQAGAESSEPTAVRIVYDQTTLFISADLADSAPDEIRATELRRDNTLETDDTFTVLLDTFHDHRNAFVFRVNPRGTRYDALIRNESRFYYADWDEQWTAAAALTETGWSVEIAIPFKTLRFTSAAEQSWGLNFERVIKRKNELVYWAGWSRDEVFQNVSQAGHLSGLRDIRQAERIRLRPYVVAGVESLAAVADSSGATGIGDVGIDDLKWAVTSTLTADLTVNADFAQAEVDAQQVNLTRFTLFFPEKRQFFIEGADSLRMGVGLLHFGPPPLELFYSRSIGLSSAGTPIPVNAGGKLSGKVAGFDIGVLNVQTGASGQAPGENFTVGRVRKEVMGRSYIGAIATNRQGGDRDNTIVGADARFTWFQRLNVMGLAARADDRAVGRAQWATQFGVEWRDDLVEAGFNYIDVDPQFNAGVGFVRVRERLTGARGSFKPRPGRWGVRQFELTPSVVQYHDSDGVLRSRETQLAFGTAFESGDRVDIRAESSAERLVRPFPVGPGVVLPPGQYDWNGATLLLRTYNGRRASTIASLTVGDFYDGTKRTLNLQGDLRPGRVVSFGPTYQLNDADLGPGSFVTHLAGLRANVSFSTNVLTSAFVQYNSAGQLAATQVRLNYIFRTIDNLYVVYTDNYFTEGPFDGRSNRSLVTKVTYSLHR